jgi:succinoglycan biosynthesis protein ExoA
MAARFLMRGSRLICLPEMAGHYLPRNSLPALARQYFRYGFYRARTFRRHPQSMRRSHLIAPLLAGALVTALFGPRPLRRVSRAPLDVYLLAVLATGASTIARREAPPREGALLSAVLPVMHFGWGFGTLAGVLRFGPPLQALVDLSGFAGGRRRTEDDREHVYAPSLHSADV